MATATAHPNTANQQIHKSAHTPQEIAIVPSRASSNASNRSERYRRRRRDVCCPRIDEPVAKADASPLSLLARRGEGTQPVCLHKFPILVGQGERDGVTDAYRTDVEYLARRIIAYHAGVAKAVNEFASDTGVERGHQPQP